LLRAAGPNESAPAERSIPGLSKSPLPAKPFAGSPPFHALANVFPLIEGVEFDELVASILANGLREPIILFQGSILDGRNRQRACHAAGVEPRYELFNGDDPAAFVIDANLRRQHLDESQRAMVAARLANLRNGQRADLVEGLPIGRAAQLLNVGERSVARAREVADHGVPSLVHAVDGGEVSVSAAADVATLPKVEQQEIVARGEREILRAARTIRARLTTERIAERMKRHAALAISVPLPQRLWPLLYVDMPLRWEVHSDAGSWRTAQEHYPTKSLDEIKAMTIPAAKDAVLFQWAWAPSLPGALEVMAAWGFKYVSHIIWEKDRVGMGYWVRSKHELLLIGKRGDIPAPAPGTQPESVIKAPVGRHSEKPEIFYSVIEKMFPGLPKLEMFARGAPRPGWTAWGNEVAAEATTS
jgi:N6-adenosine-specific RNA methylase IME4/ParB-like chromosome segregation protein Spo0J